MSEVRSSDIENRSKYEPGYRREKLSTEGEGFKGVKSGTEPNALGTTKIEVGEPKLGMNKHQMRANDKSGDIHTDRFPLHGKSPKKDKFGDTKNSGHPSHGR